MVTTTKHEAKLREQKVKTNDSELSAAKVFYFLEKFRRIFYQLWSYWTHAAFFSWVISHPIIPYLSPPLLLGKLGQSKTLKGWDIGTRMNQLLQWSLKLPLQTAKSLSRRLVAQWKASTSGLPLQQTDTRANMAGVYDSMREGSDPSMWTS